MRGLLLASVPLCLAAAACDKSGPLANLDASAPAFPSSGPLPDAGSASSDASTGAAAAGRAMPPRPVPTNAPTVTITMPMETQLKAIQYMAAMQAPQPNDAPADPEYAKDIADRLRALGKPDVIASGRTIDVKMAKGCTSTVSKEAIARHTGATLGALLTHGVLVVSCTDRSLQCLQSTRDADDVLCVHK